MPRCGPPLGDCPFRSHLIDSADDHAGLNGYTYRGVRELEDKHTVDPVLGPSRHEAKLLTGLHANASSQFNKINIGVREDMLDHRHSGSTHTARLYHSPGAAF